MKKNFTPGADFRSLLERDGHFFNQLVVGEFVVSIQASEFHYSTPRATLPEASDYSAFEVAIFFADGWVLPNHKAGEIFSDFERGGSTSVAGWQPVERVQEILELLYSYPQKQLSS